MSVGDALGGVTGGATAVGASGSTPCSTDSSADFSAVMASASSAAAATRAPAGATVSGFSVCSIVSARAATRGKPWSDAAPLRRCVTTNRSVHAGSVPAASWAAPSSSEASVSHASMRTMDFRKS